MAAFDVDPSFDPNNLQHLLTLVDNLRAAGVRTFQHPSGLNLTLDTRKPKELERVVTSSDDGDGF